MSPSQDQPLADANRDLDVIVVGGGIIGWSVASAVARRGMSVLVFEPGDSRFGTSSANAGHLVPSHAIPFASPGMVQSGLKSLAKRDGAFAISPKSARHLIPWLVRFAIASSNRNVDRGAPVLRELLATTMAEVQRLADSGANFDFGQTGLLQVFTEPASFASHLHEVESMRKWGVKVSERSASELHADDQLFTQRVVGAYLLEDDARMDPALLLQAVRDNVEANGARIVEASVTGIERVGTSAVVRTSTPDYSGVRANHVVIAAGVWSRELARALGNDFPLMPAKGYSVTVDPGPIAPSRPMVLMDQRLALSPLARGLRIASRYELTSPSDRSIPASRITQLLDAARIALNLPASTQPTNPWTGLRPALPDGVPALGRLGDTGEVFVATGHGMLGTTTGPGSGEFIAALIVGEKLPFDPAIVSPNRFRR